MIQHLFISVRITQLPSRTEWLISGNPNSDGIPAEKSVASTVQIFGCIIGTYKVGRLSHAHIAFRISDEIKFYTPLGLVSVVGQHGHRSSYYS